MDRETIKYILSVYRTDICDEDYDEVINELLERENEQQEATYSNDTFQMLIDTFRKRADTWDNGHGKTGNLIAGEMRTIIEGFEDALESPKHLGGETERN